MIRGPLQASVPSLDHFPRDAGSRAHVYPFQARCASPLTQQPAGEWKLPPSIVTANFWRSPYSDAFRHAALPRRPDPQQQQVETGKSAFGTFGRGEKSCSERAAEPVKSILKPDSRDSASDTSSDQVRKIRGILSKSSVSSSSRQSVGKVQKRVKFDVSLDRPPGPPQSFLTCTFTNGDDRPDQHQPRHLSASAGEGRGRNAQRNSIVSRHDSERLQNVKAWLHHQHVPHDQQDYASTVPSQHTLPQGGHRPPQALCRSPSASDVSSSRSLAKDPSKARSSTFELMHARPSDDVSARLTPNALEFKIYRRPLSLRSSSPSQDLGPPRGRIRYFDTRTSTSNNVNKNNSTITSSSQLSATRLAPRLSRSLTSPEIMFSRPMMRAQPCVQDELSFMLSATRLQPHLASGAGRLHRLRAAQPPSNARLSASAGSMTGEKHGHGGDDEQQSSLEDDKTVQILHWLEELGHTRTREGQCLVYPSSTISSREA